MHQLVAEFKRRHPKATATEVWLHFAGPAGMSVVVVSYSADMDAIEYVPNAEKWGTRRIKRVSFERHYRRVPDI